MAVKCFKERRIEHLNLKRALWKENLTLVPDISQPEYVFNICSKVCFSTAGFASPMRSHDSKQSRTRFILKQYRADNLYFLRQNMLLNIFTGNSRYLLIGKKCASTHKI